MGTETVATVPLFNLWTLWWNADRLGALYQGYWDAPIFYPLEGVFAFSEPQPLTGFVAAFVSGPTGSHVLAYNAVVLAALTLNGWAACQLLRAVRMRWLIALTGGAMVSCLPFIQQELGVLQLVSLGGMLATLHAFVRIAERPSVLRGVALAVAFAATSLMCGYYALSLSVLVLLGGGWLLADRLKGWGTWEALGAALLVGLAIRLPVTGQQLRVAERYELERAASTARRFSASWEDYGRTPWAQLVPAPGVDTAERPGGRAFWPGTVKVCLALAGIVWGFGWGPRRWTGFCTTVLVLGFWLSFGPGDGGPSLHRLLVSVVPGYAQLRSPFRFAVFVELMVALLAAGGLAFIHARARLPLVWRSLAVLLLGALAAMEIRPTQQHLLPIPNLEAQLPWLAWVESETSPGDALAFLPFPQGRGVEDYMETTQWMFWQMRHRRPMVNGYSGFFPRRFRELKAALEHFPDARSLEHLAKRGVRYCVVLRGVYPEDDIEAVAISTHRLRRVFGDDVAKLDVYELVGTPQAALDDLRIIPLQGVPRRF